MNTERLLRLARMTIEAAPSCVAITIDRNGNANARVVNPSQLSPVWTVRFMTDRRTRKFAEISHNGRLTLVYYDAAGGAYVTLVGAATIIEDAAVKRAIWQPASYRWHPGGPDDPNVVLVEFFAERLETWNTPEGVVPDATKGLWAAVLVREGPGWRYAGSTQEPDVKHG